MPSPALDPDRAQTQEWLETDGLGGFASGTVSGIRSRRYHALLLASTTPPTGRYVLVNAVDASVQVGDQRWAVSSHRYAPDVIAPDGWGRIESFEPRPWPTWVFALPDGTPVQREVMAIGGCPRVVLSWRLLRPKKNVRLVVRPLMSGRDYHALHRENPAFNFNPEHAPGRQAWTMYSGVPGVRISHNASYRHDPVWYRNFAYAQDRARGQDYIEDLAAPGELSFDLSAGEAVMVLDATGVPFSPAPPEAPLDRTLSGWRSSERARRAKLGDGLAYAADQYIVRRGNGRTIIAGYPWFTDWGRDTFIAMRGLCLTAGRFDDAGRILSAWAGQVSQGMLPNRFLDHPGEHAEYNTVDAPLWFIIAAEEYLAAAGAMVPGREVDALRAAIDQILRGYQNGARYRIAMDADGLIAAGEPGVQLTWMDAKVGDWVVTPRIGKPVEIQALWINALSLTARRDRAWAALRDRAQATFRERFWNASKGCLFDVIDADHVPGRVEAFIRPNQILAAGGLPQPVVEPEVARAVVGVVERELVTPMGLRSLAPSEAGYRPRYEGDLRSRDAAYHQGTVWPWFIAAFIDAWLRAHGDTPGNRSVARARFIDPLVEHLSRAGLGHVSEVADGEPPHTPGGCPFQAWSMGELVRAMSLTGGAAEPLPTPKVRVLLA